MNRSPEPTPAELAAELRLQDQRKPADPELAADWSLRRELGAMHAPALPEKLRSRVLKATGRPHRPVWWLGMAAALAVALAIVLILETERPESRPTAIAETDLYQLELALASLEFGARRTTELTGRELAASISLPDLHLDELPYADRFRQWIQPADSNDH